QGITTFFIRHGLEILGVPAYIDGFAIEIPQGTFFVAEACAGLRFLVASTAFGCLFALLIYRSPLRRGVFILVSILVPIIANGFRAIGIVYLGHILGSAEAAAADHLIYGWIFFSLVTLLLIALGLPFREDEGLRRSASLSAEERAPAVSRRRLFPVAAGIATVAAVGPVVAAGLTMAAATSVVTPFRIDVGPDCEVQPVASAEGAAVRRQRVLCGAVPLEMSWEAFSPRSTAAPLMSARRKMVAGARTEGIQENWLDQSDRTSNTWRVMKSNDPVYVIATSVWIDGKPVRPGLGMRVRMALNSLIGSDFAPMVVTVTPEVDWQARNGSEPQVAEDALPLFLLNHPGLDKTVGALSMMR
ncbi:MAG TPA: exosortase, partial [Acetobacteraceae bacterium]|nr:exosortase [Acetobacteraceae bacterium]